MTLVSLLLLRCLSHRQVSPCWTASYRMTAAKPLRLLLSGLAALSEVTEIGQLGAWRKKRLARKPKSAQNACGKRLREVVQSGPA